MKKSGLLGFLSIAAGALLSCSCTHAEKPLKFAIASDFHAVDMPDGGERIAKFISAAKDEDVDFIIELGDFLRFDSVGNSYFDVWNSFEGNKYHVVGNHDMDYYNVDEYVSGIGMPGRYYSFDEGDFHFIVLDGNNLYDGEEYTHYAYGNFYVDMEKREWLDPEQLEWLKRDLAATDKKCIIFSHQSIDAVMANGAEVREVLEAANREAGFKKVVLAFSGHTHSNYTTVINDIPYMQINSASYVWVDQPTMTEKRFPKEINDRYPFMKNSMMFDNTLYAIVELTSDGAKVKGTKAEFIPPTPEEVGLGDNVDGFPLVSVIEDAEIKF